MHPVLFHWQIGGHTLAVYSYGTMLMTALVTGWFLAVPLLKKQGFPIEKALTAVLAGVVTAIVTARLFYVLTNWGMFSGDFPVSMLDFQVRQGLVAYGGYLGAFAGSFVMAVRYGWHWLSFADIAAPSLASGLCFTRIGCFLAGCDYGLPTSSWAGIAFPANSFAWQDHLSQGLITRGAAMSLPVHPTQIYESAAGLVMCLTLLFIYSGNKMYRGMTFASFLIMYGIFRFMVEFLRGDADRGIFYGLSTSQWLAVATVVWAAWIIRRSLSDVNTRMEPDALR